MRRPRHNNYIISKLFKDEVINHIKIQRQFDWKIRLLPKPVGRQTNRSVPSKAESIASDCFGLYLSQLACHEHNYFFSNQNRSCTQLALHTYMYTHETQTAAGHVDVAEAYKTSLTLGHIINYLNLFL